MAYKDPEQKREYDREYYLANKDSIKASSRKYREENPEKVRKWHKENKEKRYINSRKFRINNPERDRAISIASNNGLDLETVYQYLLERDDVSVCDICQLECSSGKKLALDHNHENNEIRGLLCFNCNIGLSKFKDSIKLMEKAIEYLKGETKWQ